MRFSLFFIKGVKLKKIVKITKILQISKTLAAARLQHLLFEMN